MSKEYLRPGVFVEEVPPGEQPIQAVGTSTGAFVGIAERGALDKPKLVTNWSQFVKDFGAHRRDSFLAHAVQGFFLNGGSRCFVVRAASIAPAVPTSTCGDGIHTTQQAGPDTRYRWTAIASQKKSHMDDWMLSTKLVVWAYTNTVTPTPANTARATARASASGERSRR